MRRNSLFAGILLFILAPVAVAQTAGDPVAGQNKPRLCNGCHAIPGYRNAYPAYRVPKLGGQHADYIAAALKRLPERPAQPPDDACHRRHTDRSGHCRPGGILLREPQAMKTRLFVYAAVMASIALPAHAGGGPAAGKQKAAGLPRPGRNRRHAAISDLGRTIPGLPRKGVVGLQIKPAEERDHGGICGEPHRAGHGRPRKLLRQPQERAVRETGAQNPLTHKQCWITAI